MDTITIEIDEAGRPICPDCGGPMRIEGSAWFTATAVNLNEYGEWSVDLATVALSRDRTNSTLVVVDVVCDGCVEIAGIDAMQGDPCLEFRARALCA